MYQAACWGKNLTCKKVLYVLNLTENQVKGVKIWKHMQKGRDFITLQIFQALYFHQKIDWLRICILDSKFYHANKRLSELA